MLRAWKKEMESVLLGVSGGVTGKQMRAYMSTCASQVHPETCDPPGSAVATTALQTKTSLVTRAWGRVDAAGSLTVRLTPATSHHLHRPGHHSLQKKPTKKAEVDLSRRLIAGNSPGLLAHHFLKVDQFLRVVGVSLVDEGHVLEQTAERRSARTTSKPTWRLLLLPLSSRGMKGM